MPLSPSPKRCNLAVVVRVKLFLPELCLQSSPRMLFEFDPQPAKMTAREMASQCLEERQRDIYDSHRHRVFSVSYYMTGSELEAEELLRGAFIRAFRKNEEPDRAIIDEALLDQLRDRDILRQDAAAASAYRRLPSAASQHPAHRTRGSHPLSPVFRSA